MPNIKVDKKTYMVEKICIAVYNKNSQISGRGKFDVTGKISENTGNEIYFANWLETLSFVISLMMK